MKIIKEKTVAFTGYRTSKMFNGVSDANLINVIITEAFIVVKELHEKGYTTFLTGMSEGFDLIAAETVLKLKESCPDVQLVAVIPFRGQEKQYSVKDKLTYAHVLKYADHCELLAGEYIDNDQYLRRNVFLLEHSSHLVCYYDGQRGGTMYTVNRAEKSGMPITNMITILSDYMANISPIKKALEHYAHIQAFKFCKEGVMLCPSDDEPMIITFEQIEKVESNKGVLLITLDNGIIIEAHLILDDCKVTFPPMDECRPTIMDRIETGCDTLRKLLSRK